MPGLPPEHLLCIFGLTKPPMLTSGSRFSTFSDEKVQRSSNVSSRIACALLNRFVWRVTTCYVASFFGVHCPIRFAVQYSIIHRSFNAFITKNSENPFKHIHFESKK